MNLFTNISSQKTCRIITKSESSLHNKSFGFSCDDKKRKSWGQKIIKKVYAEAQFLLHELSFSGDEELTYNPLDEWENFCLLHVAQNTNTSLMFKKKFSRFCWTQSLLHRLVKKFHCLKWKHLFCWESFTFSSAWRLELEVKLALMGGEVNCLFSTKIIVFSLELFFIFLRNSQK